MGHGIIKIKDRYFLWSTVTDSPTTFAMTEADLEREIIFLYGSKGLGELPQRMTRVDKTGTSFLGETLATILVGNRAGDGEKEISANEIYEKFAKKPKTKSKKGK